MKGYTGDFWGYDQDVMEISVLALRKTHPDLNTVFHTAQKGKNTFLGLIAMSTTNSVVSYLCNMV